MELSTDEGVLDDLLHTDHGSNGAGGGAEVGDQLPDIDFLL
jgi:hypothetical protein